MTVNDKKQAAQDYFALYAAKVLGIFPSHECQNHLKNTQVRFQPLEAKSSKTFEEIFKEALDNFD